MRPINQLRMLEQYMYMIVCDLKNDKVFSFPRIHLIKIFSCTTELFLSNAKMRNLKSATYTLNSYLLG